MTDYRKLGEDYFYERLADLEDMDFGELAEVMSDPDGGVDFFDLPDKDADEIVHGYRSAYNELIARAHKW